VGAAVAWGGAALGGGVEGATAGGRGRGGGRRRGEERRRGEGGRAGRVEGDARRRRDRTARGAMAARPDDKGESVNESERVRKKGLTVGK
jgi:hypothetical protein